MYMWGPCYLGQASYVFYLPLGLQCRVLESLALEYVA